jgi:hypothetical protein
LLVIGEWLASGDLRLKERSQKHAIVLLRAQGAQIPLV